MYLEELWNIHIQIWPTLIQNVSFTSDVRIELSRQSQGTETRKAQKWLITLPDAASQCCHAIEAYPTGQILKRLRKVNIPIRDFKDLKCHPN